MRSFYYVSALFCAFSFITQSSNSSTLSNSTKKIFLSFSDTEEHVSIVVNTWNKFGYCINDASNVYVQFYSSNMPVNIHLPISHTQWKAYIEPYIGLLETNHKEELLHKLQKTTDEDIACIGNVAAILQVEALVDSCKKSILDRINKKESFNKISDMVVSLNNVFKKCFKKEDVKVLQEKLPILVETDEENRDYPRALHNCYLSYFKDWHVILQNKKLVLQKGATEIPITKDDGYSEGYFNPLKNFFLGIKAYEIKLFDVIHKPTKPVNFIEKCTIPFDNEVLASVLFHPLDASLLGLYFAQGLLKWFDVQKQLFMQQVKFDGSIEKIVVSPSGNALVGAYPDGRIMLFDIFSQKKKELSTGCAFGKKDLILVSRDDKMIVCTNNDQQCLTCIIDNFDNSTCYEATDGFGVEALDVHINSGTLAIIKKKDSICDTLVFLDYKVKKSQCYLRSLKAFNLTSCSIAFGNDNKLYLKGLSKDGDMYIFYCDVPLLRSLMDIKNAACS